MLHTAVSPNDELHFPNPAKPGIGCHFYLLKDGSLRQYLDTERRTGHAFDANQWAVALESQDSGDSDDPGPWTDAQLDTIDKLCRELGIPGQPLEELPSNGLGYHRQFPSWNQHHHTCPGDEKVAQVPGILERLKGDDMAGYSDQIGLDDDTVGNSLAFIAGARRRIKGDPKASLAGEKRQTAKEEGWEFADHLVGANKSPAAPT